MSDQQRRGAAAPQPSYAESPAGGAPIPDGAVPAYPSGYQPGARRGNPTSRPALRTWVMTGVIVVGFSLAALMIAGYYGGTLGLLTSLLALLLAAIPLGIVIPTFIWLDRFEAEPTRYLVTAALWGALVAPLVAGIFNTGASLLFETATDPTDALATTAVFVAPPVEETCKGALVLLIWRFLGREFDGLTDGMVYAGITAAGFAFTENIQYLGMALRDGGGPALAGTFVGRCVMSPFAHPMFTVLTGVGIGIAATSRRRWVKLGAPLAGWLLAVVAHAMWNLAAFTTGNGMLAVYVLVELPIFLAFLGLVVWARRREGRLIGRFLTPYADAGWLTPEEVAMLASMSHRREARGWARANGGRRGLASMRAFQDAASDLALLRRRMHVSAAGPGVLASERRLLDGLMARRSQFTGRSCL